MVVVVERRMSSTRTCRQCGARLAAEHPAEVCSACLWQGALLDEDEPETAPVPPAVPRSARLCGDYELLDQIGRGGMGVVYRARKPSLNKVFALKMLLHADIATAEELERLHIEAETAATIRHPNIVPVFDFGVSEGRHYIVMELIEGRSLAQKIAAQEFQMPRSRDAKARARARELQREIARLLVKVAHAVEHAHQCRFLHRDIKPGNILLDAKEQPYLSDFGLAKALDGARSISETGSVRGTINYMSPEQAEGKRVGFPTDVFSLGAILYELLTGRPPFRGESIGETFRRLQETDPEHPRLLCPWLDTDLATICLKCLEKDPNQRYASAGDLADDLDKWLANKPVRARPVRFFGRVQRWCQREPKIAAMAAGLFLLLSAVTLLASALFLHENENRIRADQESARRLSVLIDRIERNRASGTLVHVSAEEATEINRLEPPGEGANKRLFLAFRLPERGSDRVVPIFGLFAHCLQTSLWHRAQFGAMFDLRLYPSEPDTQGSLIKGEADLARLDPAAYVLGRRAMPGLIPVVRELYGGNSETRGAIVTHLDSGITNLAGLKGGSFAFGDPDSALGWHLPRAAMAEAGLMAGDIASTNLTYSRVLSAVRKKQVQAGVVMSDDLERLARAGVRLRVLRELRCPSFVWVVTSRLETNTVVALRKALLPLSDRMSLMLLEPTLNGFSPTLPSDYDELARQIDASKGFGAP
jgi:ABC-type phosphate/phosphonate transport system substrate-binding protein/tRNA A-37 threonylcarbamoyl transferase component Bud32